MQHFRRMVCNSSSGRVQLMSRYHERLASVALEAPLSEWRLRNTRFLSWIGANFPDGSGNVLSGTKFKQSLSIRFKLNALGTEYTIPTAAFACFAWGGMLNLHTAPSLGGLIVGSDGSHYPLHASPVDVCMHSTSARSRSDFEHSGP